MTNNDDQGLAYEDLTRARNGKYLRLAFLPYQTLKLELRQDTVISPHLQNLIIAHAKAWKCQSPIAEQTAVGLHTNKQLFERGVAVTPSRREG